VCGVSLSRVATVIMEREVHT